MADQNKSEQEKAEKTIGKEQATGGANGAPTEEEEEAAPAGTAREKARDALKEAASDAVATYEKAKRELQDSMARLRSEVSKLDVDEARQRARTWVEENPTLAVALAVGAGLVIGRLLSAALTPPPPPSLPVRLKKQSQRLASQAQHYVHDVGDVLSRRAQVAGAAAVRRAHEIGDTVSRRAAEAVEAATERAAEWGDTLGERSAEAAQALQHTAHELPGAVRERASQGLDLAESLLNAARAVTAAIVVKKVTDWFRRVA